MTTLPPALGSPDPYDVANKKMGSLILQRLNVGERTPLSAAMSSVLVLVVLYYTLSLIILYIQTTAVVVIRPLDPKPPIEEKQHMLPKPNTTKQTDSPQQLSPALSRINQAQESQRLVLMLAFLILLVRLRLKVDLESSEPPPYITNIYLLVIISCYTHAFYNDLFFCNDSQYIVTAKCILKFIVTFALNLCVVLLFYVLINQGKTHAAA
tara:strand:+ start:49 stop:678 length:630 start_codon:yes stop_codon:yes gene_type:complete